jgi:hypothetical protein
MLIYDHWLKIREQTTVTGLRVALAEGIGAVNHNLRNHHQSARDGHIQKLTWEAEYRIAILETMGWIREIAS